MKFLRLIGLLFVGTVVYQSCTSSFNPAAPYKNIPVIYGLLNQSDSIHYIKIEKAFLTQAGGNAYTAAQVGDSIYYDSTIIKASLQALNSDGSNNGGLIALTRADGAKLGVNKDTGVFASTPNIIYYTRAKLNGSLNYELVVNNSHTGKSTTSQTVLVDSFLIYNPNTENPIEFTPAFAFTASWLQGNNASIYQLVIRFHYKELPATNGDSLHVITWTFPETLNNGGTTQYQYIPGPDFFRFVAGQVAVNPLVKRTALSLDFWYYAGGASLYTYQQVSIAASTSLVEGQVNPNYTNITNGIGLFSSTLFEAQNNLLISNITVDSLAHSSFTGNLNFLDEYGKL